MTHVLNSTKRIINILLLSLIFLFSFVFSINADSAYYASGTSGDITWTITRISSDNDILTISGNGDMPDYSLSSSYWGGTTSTAPWYSYHSTISKIVIENGVTSIGNYAFYYISEKEVSIPNSVTKIGNYAFWDNYKLENSVGSESLVIPNTVTSIGNYAFESCAKLKSIKPFDTENNAKLSSLTSIGSYTFNKSGIEKFYIPSSVTSVSSYAFGNCEQLATISISEGLSSIPSYMCYRCSLLNDITIPSSVLSIGSNAFYGCKTNGNVHYLNNDLANWAQIVFADAAANPLSNNGYIYCYNTLFKDNSIVMHTNSGPMSKYAFYNCQNTFMAYSNGGWPYNIPDYAFYGCTNLTGISFASDTSSVGSYAFYNCSNIANDYKYNTFKNFGDYSFYGCSKLTSWSFPKDTTIGKSAFANTGLTDVSIKEGTSISYYAFEDSNLSKITFNGTAPISISSNAFNGLTINATYQPGDSWLSKIQNYGGSITWNKTEKVIGGLTVTLNDEYKLITSGTGSLSYNPFSTIKDVELNEGVTGITLSAFDDAECNTITLPESLSLLNGVSGSTVYSKLYNLIFLGDAPTFDDTSLNKFSGIARYNVTKDGWDEDALSNHGSESITWSPYCSIINNELKYHDLSHIDRVEPQYEVDGNIEYWVCKNCGTIYGDEAATTAITIEETVIPALNYIYSASVSAPSSVVVGENITFKVSLNVPFASGELEVNYDKDKVKFISSNNNATCNDDKNGTVTMSLYGANGISNLTVTFEAIADGSCDIALKSASFGTKEEAETQDLKPAKLTSSEKTVVIKKGIHVVTLPAIFEGASTVNHGSDYTFVAKDNEHYNYSGFKAIADGQELTIVVNNDGSWTVKNVVDDVVITATQEGKKYQISYSTTSDAILPESPIEGNYGETIEVTIPQEDDWAYIVTSVKSNDIDVDFSFENNVLSFTMPETTSIVIDKETRKLSVTVEGNAASDVTAESSYTYDTDFVFTVTKDQCYDYSIKVKVNDVEVTPSIEENTYTITKPQYGGIVISANKTLISGNISVTDYIKLDGKSFFLIKNEIDKVDGRHYVFGQEDMWWSDKYNAYVTLVVSTNLPVALEENFDLVEGDARVINYDMDVNMTEHIDSNDAQLVWNMYNAEYDSFTDNVTMEKFLKADVNGDGLVNIADAVAIVNEVLEIESE